MLIGLAFLSVFLLSEAVSDPDIFEKCKKHDPELSKCITANVNKEWATFVRAKGLEKIPVNTKKNVPYFVDGKMKGFLEGFDNIVFNNIYTNFENKTVDVVYTQPIMSVNVDYVMKGSLLRVDLADKGIANTTYFNGIYKYHFDYDVEERDGDEYIKITTFSLTYNVDKIIFQMDSKINKKRGELITNLFNNFWRLINILADTYMGEILSEAYTPIIQRYFNKIPMKILFAE